MPPSQMVRKLQRWGWLLKQSQENNGCEFKKNRECTQLMLLLTHNRLTEENRRKDKEMIPLFPCEKNDQEEIQKEA